MDKKQTLDRINEAAARILENVGVLRRGADDDACIKFANLKCDITLNAQAIIELLNNL